MKRNAIILAAGNSVRFDSQVQKQFQLVHGKPLIYYSLKAFEAFDSAMNLILVLNPEAFDAWSNICQTAEVHIPHQVIAGGSTRAESVFKALQTLEEESMVMIHDAARPVLSQTLLNDLYQAFLKADNAIPVIPVKDSLRKANGIKTEAVDRKKFRQVQTPQVFKVEDLKRAFAQTGSMHFDDESALVEAAGMTIHEVAGDHNNIKVTFPLDIQLASLLLQS